MYQETCPKIVPFRLTFFPNGIIISFLLLFIFTNKIIEMLLSILFFPRNYAFQRKHLKTKPLLTAVGKCILVRVYTMANFVWSPTRYGYLITETCYNIPCIDTICCIFSCILLHVLAFMACCLLLDLELFSYALNK